MRRRGEITIPNLLVGFIIAGAILFTLLYFFNDTRVSFLDAITCDDQHDRRLIQLPQEPGGACKESEGLTTFHRGFLHERGKECCFITDYDPKDEKKWSGLRRDGVGASATSSGVAVQGMEMTSSLTGNALPEGATVPIYASHSADSSVTIVPNEVVASATLTCPEKGCPTTIKCEETLTTVTGVDVKELLDQRYCNTEGTVTLGNQVTVDIKSINGKIRIRPDPAYADQTLLYTLRLTYEGAELESYTLKFRISSPVKFAGLSQTWSKRKDVTAACESPVTCSEILFRVVPKPTQSVPKTLDGSNTGSNTQSGSTTTSGGNTASNAQSSTTVSSSCDFTGVNPSTAQELKTQYCVVKDGKLQIGMCDTTYNACTQRIAALTDSEYTAMHALLVSAIKNGVIKEGDALNFANEQGDQSTYSCVKNADTTVAGQAYRVPVDVTTGRASFTLDQKSFEGQYLCIYGKDKNANIVYASKGPVKIALDVTPPVAHLEFKPATLQFRFGCTDTTDGGASDTDSVSGCKDTFGTAYISKTGDFLRSLVQKNNPQNAAAWCPAYASSAGYNSESRPITQYTGNEVRVLCLRVEDNAGNAGVAMTTVYNAYDIFLNALAAYTHEAST